MASKAVLFEDKINTTFNLVKFLGLVFLYAFFTKTSLKFINRLVSFLTFLFH